ncbi:MAG: methyltransferase domain-containing protein [Candidatus Omnitrophica bacterium]|nr:methyltransferase domain-containing protein [Candidatus Omnitrophota bacterium]
MMEIEGITEAALTMDAFRGRLQRILQRVQEIDPAGVNPAVRLVVSFGLYASYDGLRSQERPFDREAFAQRLGVIDELLAHGPVAMRQSISPSPPPRDPEEVVAELYSQCWANYDDEAFLGTVSLFEERFAVNNIALDFLHGATCLDAGCGSGRYTLAMARLGATWSVGIDISREAIRQATERSHRLGVADRVSFCHGSVLAMPQEWTERFDVVCSNGVVHHTADPVKGLQEIFRVLTPGGRAYIFVYGRGGLFWELVDVIRALMRPVPLGFAMRWMQAIGAPPGKIFNYLDHWCTPIQERVSRDEYESRLRRCGFTELVYLPRAKIYDASERLTRFPEDRDLVGEGDLRYLVRKPSRQAG